MQGNKKEIDTGTNSPDIDPINSVNPSRTTQEANAVTSYGKDAADTLDMKKDDIGEKEISGTVPTNVTPIERARKKKMPKEAQTLSNNPNDNESVDETLDNDNSVDASHQEDPVIRDEKGIHFESNVGIMRGNGEYRGVMNPNPNILPGMGAATGSTGSTDRSEETKPFDKNEKKRVS